jgi:uncharacterized protein YtpQ (UPF0354 family)
MFSINRRRLLAMALFPALLSWLGLAKAAKSRFANIAEFRELVIAAFKRQKGIDGAIADPSDPAKINITIGGSSWTIDVTNVYGHVMAYPDEDVDQAIGRIVGAAVEGRPKSVSDDVVVAVIRNREYVDFFKEKGTNIVAEPLGADLMIVYMADRPNSMAPIMSEEASGIELSDLRKMALNNVRQWLPKVVSDNRLQLGVLYFVEGNTMLSTSLVLIDEFWKSVETRFPGDVLIALPRRDQLFIFDDGNPEAKTVARRLIGNTVKENFNLLSQNLYARRGGKIVLVAD